MNALRLVKYIIYGTAIGLALLIVSSATAATPTGGGPSDALMVPSDSQEIAPYTNVWFYFDYAVDYSSGSTSTTSTGPSGLGGGAGHGAQSSATTGAAVEVAVDAGGDKNVQFVIYTPGQAATWLNDPSVTPVGRGTAYSDTLTGVLIDDLHWSGAFNAAGRYYVVVSNLGSEPASIWLTVSGANVTLYPVATVTPTPTLSVPVTVTPAPTANVQGKIVFETETGGDIYTVNGDGTGLTLVTHGIDPSWSPDGKQITFARWDNDAPGVYVADADGSNEKRVFGAPRARWPRYSPDGKYIVFSEDKSKSDSQTLWKLGLIDTATGKLTEPQCSQLCYSPSWGDDSTTIYYTYPDAGLMKTSILGGSPTLVLGPSGTYYDTSANIIRPILHMPQIQNGEVSVDGGRIVYTQAAADRWEVSVASADGSGASAVTTPDPVAYYILGDAAHNVAPTWSPDASQILFLSNRNGKWEFFVSDADGSNVRQVLENVTDKVSIKFDYQNERIMDWTGSASVSQ